jgi:NAD(P) transhydrogenase subunit alpha
VLVDLAVAQGGNIEGVACDQIIDVGGVKIVGFSNLPARVATDASALYARNLAAFAALLVKDGELVSDFDDEILKASLVARSGAVVHPALQAA